MAFKKSKMADSVSAFISTVKDKVNEQQEEEKAQPEQKEQQPEQNIQQPQAKTEQQSKPTAVKESKPKKMQYRTPARLMTDQKQISLRLPMDVYEQIVEYSQKEYISMNTFIIKALKNELEKIQNQQQ